MSTAHTFRFHELDALRGMFALAIVIWHYDNRLLPFPWHGQLWYDHLYLVVDFFFCLSGFVISFRYPHQMDVKSLRTFLYKRLKRIYPLLFFSTMVYGTFRTTAYFLFPNSLSTETSLHTILVDFGNTLFMLNSTPVLGMTHGMNVPSWSISAEFFAYLLFAILAFFQRKLLLWGITMIAVAVAFSRFATTHDTSFDYGFLRGALGFGFGVVGSMLLVGLKRHASTKPLSTLWNLGLSISTLGLISMAFLIADGRLSPLPKLVMVNLIFSIVILAFGMFPGLGGKVLTNRFTRWLGEISFSIYLNHLIVLLIVQHLLTQYGNSTFESRLVAFGISILAVLGYSQLTRIWVEKKMGSALFQGFRSINH